MPVEVCGEGEGERGETRLSDEMGEEGVAAPGVLLLAGGWLEV